MATETENRASVPQLITVTPKAIVHVKELMERAGKPDSYLRVAAVAGGCSGFSYKLDLDESPKPEDRVIDAGEGLQVLLDMKSSLFLSGMELDYNDDLMNAGFAFRNPNAKHSCGCGSSFGV